jgi:Flp pilus assembly protein TadG
MRNRRRGSTLLEFTLTAIPMLFLSLSVVECALAMLEYDSMANAATVAARYAANHGATCAQSPNSCTVRIEDVANLIAATTWIISTSTLNVTFTDPSGSTTCELSVCKTNASTFPSSTSNANAVGNPITIKVTHTTVNPLPMFWPPKADADDTGYTLGAASVQVIQF